MSASAADNWARRFIRRTAATRPVSKLYARTLHHVDRRVYDATDGRTTFTSWAAGVPVVMLTTTGAKSGKRRTLPVLGFVEGDDVVVIASNFGQRHHPAWYHNLRANPRATIVLDGRTTEVEAGMVTGAEREPHFERAIATYPGFAAYSRRAGREIPIVRLSPARE